MASVIIPFPVFILFIINVFSSLFLAALIMGKRHRARASGGSRAAASGTRFQEGNTPFEALANTT